MNACCSTKSESNAVAQSCNSQVTFTPRVDVWETENEFLVQADIPGVEPGNISLNFENSQLALHAKVNAAEAPPRSLQREYGLGDYHRTFAINEEIDGTKISADYKHGVLTVKLPKREEIKPRKIEITV